MKIFTLTDVHNCLKASVGEIIELPEDVRIKAKACIDRVIELV